MEPQLGDSVKVCGFCSQLTEEADYLSPSLLRFLADYLRVPALRLPTMICQDCHKRSVNARKFSEKCHRAFEKLQKNGITGGMVWGRAQDSRGGEEYSFRLHGPLKFPKISLTALDREMAERHLALTVRPDSDSGEEVFPEVGPFQCEMCQDVSSTKQDFLHHIKDNHRDFIDPDVLYSLESDIRKRERKILKSQKVQSVARKSGDSQSVKRKSEKAEVVKKEESPTVKTTPSKSQTVKKKNKKSKKSKKRKRLSESESDEDFTLSLPKKKCGITYSDLQYIDEEGNPLPRAAGKSPGKF